MWEASHRPFNLAKKLVRAASPLENRDYFRRAIEWLAQISVTAYSVHPGSYTDRPKAAWEIFLTNLEWLKAECLSHKIELGVETMYPIYNENRRYFLDDLDSIEQL